MMRTMRALLFYAVWFPVSAAMAAWAMATARNRPDEILRHMRRWARFSLWAVSAICGIRYRVTGLDRLPKGAVILASRHQSAFDTIVWFHLVPNASYVLKDQLTKLPFAGPLLVPAGMIAVDRDGGAKTMRGLIKDGRQAVRDGRQIVIFPEGTRAPPDQLLPLQPGVAALAAIAKVPVHPVLTDSGLFWGRRAFGKRPGTIQIEVCPPLPSDIERQDFMDRLQAELARPLSPIDR